jgi:hypothetical protein
MKDDNGRPSLDSDQEEQFYDAATRFGSEDPESIDWEGDPLIAQDGSAEPPTWSHTYFAQFTPRTPEAVPEDEAL